MTQPAQQQSQLFEMPSGATLAVTTANFQDSWALTKAALKTLKGMDLKPEDVKPDDWMKLKSGKLTLAPLLLILDRVIDFATSPEVETAMWKCAVRANYIPAGSDVGFAGIRVTRDLFDDPSFGNTAREDWPKIMAKILEVNCMPFLAKALSGLKAAPTETASSESPKSE
jgi:hypothetical protein